MPRWNPKEKRTSRRRYNQGKWHQNRKGQWYMFWEGSWRKVFMNDEWLKTEKERRKK